MQEGDREDSTALQPTAQSEVSPPVRQRAGDADRDAAVARLRDAAIDGRLTLDEFSTRVERALQARTHEELQELLADLAGTAITPAGSAPPAARWVVASRMERRGRWQLPDDYRLKVLCGTVMLDLGQAVIHGSTATLHVRNLFGTVTILVPEAVRVEIDEGGAFATNDVETPDVAPPMSAPLIRIVTSGTCGSNYIKVVRTPAVTVEGAALLPSGE